MYLRDEKLILILGYINDADQIFLNGKLLGQTGEMKPNKNRNSKKDTERAYFIVNDLLNAEGTNTIAIRVRDYGKVGGIYKGYVGIATRKNYMQYSKAK